MERLAFELFMHGKLCGRVDDPGGVPVTFLFDLGDYVQGAIEEGDPDCAPGGH
jgi:hypothetical protein